MPTTPTTPTTPTAFKSFRCTELFISLGSLDISLGLREKLNSFFPLYYSYSRLLQEAWGFHIPIFSKDIQPPGTNLYFKYEFVPATPATAFGKTRQPTWYGVMSACKSSCGSWAYWFLSWSLVPATILSSTHRRLGHINWLLCVVMCFC